MYICIKNTAIHIKVHACLHKIHVNVYKCAIMVTMCMCSYIKVQVRQHESAGTVAWKKNELFFKSKYMI